MMATHHTRDTDPAYPHPQGCTYPGITIRQWYAGLAMQGLMANHEFSTKSEEAITTYAFQQADSMLAHEPP